MIMRDPFKCASLFLRTLPERLDCNKVMRLDSGIFPTELTNRNLLFDIRANEIARQELLPDHSRFMLKTCLERL